MRTRIGIKVQNCRVFMCNFNSQSVFYCLFIYVNASLDEILFVGI